MIVFYIDLIRDIKARFSRTWKIIGKSGKVTERVIDKRLISGIYYLGIVMSIVNVLQ